MPRRRGHQSRRGRAGMPPWERRRPLAVEAAVAEFAERGYRSTTMDHVAARLGVTKPVIYEHFGSKEELFEAVVAAETERMLDFLFAAYGRTVEMTVRERLRAAMGAIFRYGERHPDGFRLLFAASRAEGEGVRRRLESARLQVADRVAEMVRRDLRRVDAPAGAAGEVITWALLGMTERVAERRLLTPEWDTDAVVDLLADMAFSGVGGLDPDLIAAAEIGGGASEMGGAQPEEEGKQ